MFTQRSNTYRITGKLFKEDRMVDTMRVLKKQWKASLTLLLLFFAVIIGGGFYLDHLNLVPTAVPTTFVAIMAPTVYYFYSEILNRPMVSVEKDQTLFVAPMVALIDEEQIQQATGVKIQTSQILRPAIFYQLSVENNGKSTARNAMVHIRLVPEKEGEPNFDYYGRWSDPGNSDRYDLLPGQSRDIMILKLFLTLDFFPIIDFTQSQSPSHGSGIVKVNPPGNPSGEIRCFSEIKKEDISPEPYIPRERPPERSERSINGGWAGRNIFQQLESIDAEYNVEARVIAGNYRSEWDKKIDTISISELVLAAADDTIWQEQWDQKGDLKHEIQEATSDWKDGRRKEE